MVLWLGYTDFSLKLLILDIYLFMVLLVSCDNITLTNGPIAVQEWSNGTNKIWGLNGFQIIDFYIARFLDCEIFRFLAWFFHFVCVQRSFCMSWVQAGLNGSRMRFKNLFNIFSSEHGFNDFWIYLSSKISM